MPLNIVDASGSSGAAWGRESEDRSDSVPWENPRLVEEPVLDDTGLAADVIADAEGVEV